MMRPFLLPAAAVLAIAACAGPPPPLGEVSVDPAGSPPERLSEFELFRWDGEAGFTYNDGVMPYEMATPLFSDHAKKDRALWMPDGGAATFDALEAFAFPVGSAIIKSFSFPADLRKPDEDVRMVETRILIHEEDGWEAYPYLWDDQGYDATLAVGGSVTDVEIIDTEGEPQSFAYLVPQKNQCVDCHELKQDFGRFFTPIGPKARHLNRVVDHGEGPVNQLTHLADSGLLDGLPALDQVDTAFLWDRVEQEGVDALSDEEIEMAARDYLDVNCAHCHNPRGTEGISSQLFLNRDNDKPFNLGVCKSPGSAGHGTGGFTYDIVPGSPETSILVYRMQTEDLGSMMPDIGRSIVHQDGVDVVSRWIRGLEGSCSQ